MAKRGWCIDGLHDKCEQQRVNVACDCCAVKHKIKRVVRKKRTQQRRKQK